MLIPSHATPDLTFPLAGGGTWALFQQTPENFTLIVFYRGLHCPICKGYLQGLQQRLDQFAERGINVITISGDTKERAEQSVTDWEVGNLTVGYGLSTETAREWGLYISDGVGEAEPTVFSEPGMFLIRPDGELYYASTQNVPFARPNIDELLGGLDFVTQRNFPIRGARAEAV